MLFTHFIFAISLISALFTEEPKPNQDKQYFDWNNSTVYFLLTDRFYNGDKSNDMNFKRKEETSHLRGFEGGDIKGISQKIREGYFQDLGVDVIWFSPVIEQIHGFVNEGQGNTFAYHGYWPKDWTSMEPNFGTEEDLRELMKLAHENNIRVMMDVIINHTGPVTEKDPVWPNDWVRTNPQCTYQDSESTISCTLVKNLPDVLTDQTKEVELPKYLLEKWEKEGRLEKEIEELEAFFAETNYPRLPKYYIIKWLTDYIREFGIDGFRVDTVKHTEANVWDDLAKEAAKAFKQWTSTNKEAIQEGQEFFMLGEVYNYNILSGPLFDFGDRKVNYFKNGFKSLINFGFKGDANQSYNDLFTKYSNQLNSEDFEGITVMNYVSSHDDGHPFDTERKRNFEAATKLLLSPGMAQIYYGDEIARPLKIEGTQGDANLRGMMTWENNDQKELFIHWQKLGKFRSAHPSIGAGEHHLISNAPYVFMRDYKKNGQEDQVLIGLDLPQEAFSLSLKEYYIDGSVLIDKYSDTQYKVANGSIQIQTNKGIVLLEQMAK